MEKHEHKQMPIMQDGEVIFEVDEKLQSIIQFYVDNDIMTFASCQDNNGKVWIDYFLDDWMFITKNGFDEESKELYDFIEDECEVLLLSTDDGEPDENGEYWIEGKNLIWSASVRFNNEYLEAFEQLVRTTFLNTKPGDLVH